MRMLRMRVNLGANVENKMLQALDIVFTRNFQCTCTWAGQSRTGPKSRISDKLNVLRVFRQIGEREDEIVTDDKLCAFFMKKLKNATKRKDIKGLRRSTQHTVRRKGTIQKVNFVKTIYRFFRTYV